MSPKKLIIIRYKVVIQSNQLITHICIMISDLPTDVLAYLLTYLPLLHVEGTTRQLNKWWVKLVDDPKTTNARREISLDNQTIPNMINDIVLYDTISKYTRITRIDLSNCKKITDIGIIAMCTLNRTFVSVILHNCTQLTEKSILQLSRNCKSLQLLAFSYCNNITDKVFIELCKNCPKLRIIKTSSNITDTSIDSLIQHCPNIYKIGLLDATISDLQIIRLCETYKLKSLMINLKDSPINSILDILNKCPQLFEYVCFSHSFSYIVF